MRHLAAVACWACSGIALAAVPSDPQATGEPGSVGACRRAAAELARADYEYQASLASAELQLGSIEEVVNRPLELLEHLRSVIAVQTANEAERLGDEYRQAMIVQKSEMILSDGGSEGTNLDRLCWQGTNNGHVAVQLRDPQGHLDGKPIADPATHQVWGLPAPHDLLQIPGSENLLLPGSHFEVCFFARPIPGASSLIPAGRARHPSRAGVWRLVFRDVLLVDRELRQQPNDGSRVLGIGRQRGLRRSRESMGERVEQRVFARQLQAFAARLPEGQLLDLLMRSGTATAVASAQAAWQGCE